MTATSVEVALESKRSTRRRRRFSSHSRAAYLFLAPFLFLFLAFMVAPMVYSLGLSLFVEQRVGGSRFVGAENYFRVFADPNFMAGLLNVLLYTAIQVPVTIIVALSLALILDSGRVKGKPLFQLGFFIPFAIPIVVSTLLWGYLYGPSFGIFSQVFEALGLPAPNLLGDGSVFPSMANIAVWAAAGASMVILYAALRSIPGELFESAALDGASAWQVIRHVKLPMLRTTIIFTAILGIIGSLQLFAEPSILAPLAPGVITRSFTPNLYSYNLVSGTQEYNYAAAVAFTLAVVIIVLTGLFLTISNRKARAQR